MLGQVLNKKGLKHGSGEGTEIRCEFSSISVHLGSPFWGQFSSKKGPKAESKTKFKNESLKFDVGRVEPPQVGSDEAPSRPTTTIGLVVCRNLRCIILYVGTYDEYAIIESGKRNMFV